MIYKIRTERPEDYADIGYWVPVEQDIRTGGYIYHGPYYFKSEALEKTTPYEWLVYCGMNDSVAVSRNGSRLRKYWKEWGEDCPCGGSTQVLSNDPRPEIVWEEDIVRCDSCYCLGWIECDDHAYACWPDDTCAKCYRDGLGEERKG